MTILDLEEWLPGSVPSLWLTQLVSMSRDHPAEYPAIALTSGRKGPDDYLKDGRTLYALLVTHMYAQCSDARDRIFALLGLVRSAERQELAMIFPDYRLSIRQVMIVTLAHLRRFASLLSAKRALDSLRIADSAELPFLLKCAEDIRGVYAIPHQSWSPAELMALLQGPCQDTLASAESIQLLPFEIPADMEFRALTSSLWQRS